MKALTPDQIEKFWAFSMKRWHQTIKFGRIWCWAEVSYLTLKSLHHI